MTRRPLLAAVPLALALLAGSAAAQAPAAPPLPWDVPSAQVGPKLEAAGFRRAPAETHRVVHAPGGQIRREAADASQSTYTRESAGVTESVFVRAGAGRAVLMSYTAMGDSASLQVKLDGMAADASRKLGADARRGILRSWQGGEGERVSAPALPSRLPDARYQIVVFYNRS